MQVCFLKMMWVLQAKQEREQANPERVTSKSLQPLDTEAGPSTGSRHEQSQQGPPWLVQGQPTVSGMLVPVSTHTGWACLRQHIWGTRTSLNFLLSQAEKAAFPLSLVLILLPWRKWPGHSPSPQTGKFNFTYVAVMHHLCRHTPHPHTPAQAKCSIHVWHAKLLKRLFTSTNTRPRHKFWKLCKMTSEHWKARNG